MNNNRKLQLNRETVRTLSAQEMAGVAGGAVLKHSAYSCATYLCSAGCPKASPQLTSMGR